MNDKRRKRIAEIITTLRQANTDLENIRDEEQDYLDAMPEGIQNGEKGDLVQVTVSTIEDVQGELETAIETLTDTLT